jgi:serine/threonine protein kinase/lipopolysaccharide biosynthesis regulator YciM
MADQTLVGELVERVLNDRLTPEEACAHSPELLIEVKNRLEKCRSVNLLLEQLFPSDLPESDSIPFPSLQSPLPKIPGYDVLGVLGRGGIGIIYRVRHIKLNRVSALKMLLSGAYASSAELARFMREARAVAALKHQNIVQIYDVYELEGRPYFTMELVEGGSLAQQIAGAQPDARRAAQVVLALAQAVHAAHQVGIVHRDLKPANVLLTADGVPKISDFGLATRFADEPSITGNEARLGTPSYMAPEQATGSPGANSPAVDIYALGAILYELLTGRPPFRAETQAETVRKVISQDPVAPSQLNPRIPRDVETICLKCLSKAPESRYGNAAALADDLDRFLDGRPIQARPLGPVPRLGRWCRRNPAAVAITLILATAATVSTWQAVRATRAQTAARISEQRALQSATAEKLANEETKKRLGQVLRANNLLASIFENLDPKQVAEADRPLQAILADKLDKAVELLAGDSIGDPLVVATIQEKLGLSLLGLGQPRKAIALFERAYNTRVALQGPEYRQTLINLDHQAKAYWADGQMDKALPLQEKALQLIRAAFPPDDPNTLNCMNNLGLMYQQLGRLNDALPLQEETLKRKTATFGADHPDTLSSMNNLAITYQALGKLDQAVNLFEETLRVRKAKLGLNHPQTLTTMLNLAQTYQTARKLDQALPLFEETAKLRRATLGPDHPDTILSMNQLAIAYRETGQFDKAILLFQEVLERRMATLGPDETETLRSMNNVGTTYQSVGQLNKALPLLEETLAKTTAKLGPTDLLTLTTMENLAAAYLKAKELDRALSLLNTMLAGHRARLGGDNPELARFQASVALYLLNADQFAAAEPILRDCIGIREKAMPDSWQTFNAHAMLGGSLLGQQKYDQAEPLLLKGYHGMKARRAQMSPGAQPRLAETTERLVRLYEQTDNNDEALIWRQEVENLRTKVKTTQPNP